MKYQLVLQFPADSFSNDDAAAALEDELIKALGESAYVDGHDFGPTETTIFIFTPDPAVTFEQTCPILERRDLLEAVTAAYREADGESYKVIWPKDWKKEFKIG